MNDVHHEVALAQADKVDQSLTAIQRTLRWLVAATVMLYLGLGAITVVNRIDAAHNRAAICAVRDDQLKRVVQTEQFLKDNPKGAAGIPADALRQTIKNAQDTADALSAANCPDGAVGDATTTASKITRVEIQALVGVNP